jgi:uncharacterized Zn finger protein
VQIPKITAHDVRRHCGDRNFERGEQYYKNGSIFEARIDKQTLKASCSGSRDTAYRVTAGFRKSGIGLSDGVTEIIMKLASDDEKRTVATRLGELLQKSGHPDYEYWAYERHKDFLDNLS